MDMTMPYSLKLRIADFEALARVGAFDGLKKVELIDGAVVAMNAEYSSHTVAKNELMFRLRMAVQLLDPSLSAFVEPSLALPPHNLPEPDVVIARTPGGRRYFELRDVLLVIEVADSSIDYDLGAKQAIYAAGDVPEYWVVDLTTARLHQFWSPDRGSFSQRRDSPLGARIKSATIPGLEVESDGLI